jgi:hypothetical protein
VDSSSDKQMMSARPLIVGATVATGVFGPSLLSYNCSDVLVVTGRLPVAAVTDRVVGDVNHFSFVFFK